MPVGTQTVWDTPSQNCFLSGPSQKNNLPTPGKPSVMDFVSCCGSITYPSRIEEEHTTFDVRFVCKFGEQTNIKCPPSWLKGKPQKGEQGVRVFLTQWDLELRGRRGEKAPNPGAPGRHCGASTPEYLAFTQASVNGKINM